MMEMPHESINKHAELDGKNCQCGVYWIWKTSCEWEVVGDSEKMAMLCGS